MSVPLEFYNVRPIGVLQCTFYWSSTMYVLSNFYSVRFIGSYNVHSDFYSVRPIKVLQYPFNWSSTVSVLNEFYSIRSIGVLRCTFYRSFTMSNLYEL